MTTTNTHPATGLPSGGSMARLLRRALTFLAIAFGLLAPAHARTLLRRNLIILLTSLALWVAPNTTFAALAAGDIAIIGFNSDATSDEMTIVTLAPIAGGEVIYISDHFWDETNTRFANDGNNGTTVNNTDGTITWTPASAIAAGTVIKFTITMGSPATVAGLPGTVTTTGWSTGLVASGGDNWFIYQGTSRSVPTNWIFGWANWSSPTTPTFAWLTSSASVTGTTSMLPSGLTNGTNAIALTGSTIITPTQQNPHFDNMVYTGTKTGTKTAILTAVCTSSNWIGDEITPYDIAAGGTSFPGTNPIFMVSAPATAPVVTTATQSGVAATSATLGGEVTADGGAAVTDRGIVWNTTGTPTTADTKVAIGTGTGVFSATVTGLPAGTTVHVRAYAINSVDTSYGPAISFATPPLVLPTIVTNTLNSGTGSLRQAVLNANANPGADTITFDPTVFATAQTIVLATANFAPFTGDTTVTGPAAGVTVHGGLIAGTGVFTVGAGTTASFSKLTINGGSNGILNHGTLTASNCGFFQNGVGINNVNTATVTGCSFVGHSIGIYNGLLPVNAAATLTVSDCSFTDFGFAAIQNNGTATMNGCTTDNSVASGDYTLYNNSGATLTLTNCSLLDSSAGASFLNAGTLTFQNCTVVELYFSGLTQNEGTLTLKNTIFLKQPASGTVGNPFIDGGGNLILNRTSGNPSDFAADLTTLGLDPAGLQNNGGPTKTFKLLGGAAINGGLAANVPGGVTTDQRGSGFPRSVGTVDIGAYEHPSPVQLVATTASAAEGTGAGTTAFTFTVSRPGATTDAVTVNYAVTGTGTNPADAADFGGTLPSGILTLAIGEATANIVIPVTKDNLVEPTETFTLALSNPTANHAIAGNGAVATIANDDFNASPTFSGYAFSTPKNTPATVDAVKILARAADTDGGTLALTAISATSTQGGSVSLSSGNVTYTPANNFTGLDTFSVTISDGQGGTVVGTVTVSVTTGNGEGLNRAQLSIQPNGNVALLFMGIPGQQYVIQRSPDLQTWTPVFTGPAAADGTLPFTDTSPLPGAGFYRTAIPKDTGVELID